MTAARRRRPVQARSRETVDRIVGAARALLAREGAAAFNTNRLAAEAGLGVGSVYEYFPNKQAIVSRLLDDTAEAESSAILALFEQLEGEPLEQVIDQIVALTFALYRDNVGLYRVLWALSSEVREVGQRPAERLIIGEIDRRLRPRAAELRIDDVALASFVAFHMVESLASRLAEQGEAWPTQVRTREITRSVRRYLGIPAPQTC